MQPSITTRHDPGLAWESDYAVRQRSGERTVMDRKSIARRAMNVALPLVWIYQSMLQLDSK